MSFPRLSSAALAWLALSGALASAQGAPASSSQPASKTSSAASQEAPKEASAPLLAPPEGPRKTYQARPIQGTIEIDGAIKEPDWAAAEQRDDFLQSAPTPGVRPDVPTSFRVLYDPKALYVAVRCEQPAEPRVRTLRRDNGALFDDDSVSVKVDPYLDRRTTMYFATNAAGAELDRLVLENGNQVITAFDALWEVATTTDASGWTAEFRIPFTAMGVPGGKGPKTIGFDIRRDFAPKNQRYSWVVVPKGVSDDSATLYADLLGIEDIEGGQPILFTPYLVAGSTSGLGPETHQGFDVRATLGALGSAQQLSINTDFAQVSPDDAFVNLDRFAVALPERRPFFLEGTEIFSFGSAGQNQLFFSRRIGIEDDISGASLIVPMDLGLKTQGRSGPYSFGLLNALTGSSPGLEPGTTIDPANYTVARVRRELGSSANSGLLLTYKQILDGEDAADPSNVAVGWDTSARWLDDRLKATAFIAYTRTAELVRDDDGRPLPNPNGNLQLARQDGYSSEARLSYSGELVGSSLSLSYVSPTYDPQVGFVPRTDLAKAAGELVFVPQPEKESAKLAAVPFGVEAFVNTDSALGEVLDARAGPFFVMSWKSGYELGTGGGYGYELLNEEGGGFEPLPGLFIPNGSYAGEGLSIFGTTPGTKDLLFGGEIFAIRTDRLPDEASSEELTRLDYGGSLNLRANLGRYVTTSLGLSDNVLALIRPSGEPQKASANVLTVNGGLALALNTSLSVDSIFQFFDILDLDGLSLQEEAPLVTARLFGTGLLQSRLSWRFRPGSDLFLIYTASRPLSSLDEPDAPFEHSIVMKIALALEVAKGRGQAPAGAK